MTDKQRLKTSTSNAALVSRMFSMRDSFSNDVKPIFLNRPETAAPRTKKGASGGGTSKGKSSGINYSDSKVVKELTEKYEFFNDTKFEPVFVTIAYCHSFLQNLFQSNVFIANWKVGDHSTPTIKLDNIMEKLRFSQGDPILSHLKITDDYVEIGLPLPPLSMYIDESYLSDYTSGSMNKDSLFKVIKAFFLDFKIPDTFTTEYKDYDTKRIAPFLGKSRSKTIKEIQALADLAPFIGRDNKPLQKFTPHFKYDDFEKFAENQGFDVRFVLNNTKEAFTTPIPQETGKRADLGEQIDSGLAGIISTKAEVDDRRGFLKYTFRVDCYLRLPLEYALFSVTADSKKNFIPLYFSQHFHKHRLFAPGRMKRSQDEMKANVQNLKYNFDLSPNRAERIELRIIPENVIPIENQKRISTYNLNPPRRGNEKGYLINRMGEIYYIEPEANLTEQYVAKMRDTHDEDTDTIKKPDLTSLANKTILTDWLNNKALVVLESSRYMGKDKIEKIEYSSQMIDLEGAVPFDNLSYGALFSRPITLAMLNNIGVIAEYLDIQISEQFASWVPPYEYRFCGYAYINKAKDFTSKFWTLNKDEPETNLIGFEHVFNPVEESDAIEAGERDYTGWAYCAELVRICKGIWKNWNKVGNNLPWLVTHGEARLIIETVATLTRDKYNLIVYAYNKNSVLNTVKQSLDPALPALDIEMPNLPGLDSLMPHQALGLRNIFASNPRATYLDFSPGGGKTISLICDIMNLKKHGRCKRALVCVPSYLIQGFIQEINVVSLGKINGFAITRETVERFIGPKSLLNANADTFVKWINSTPPNTIFVTSYSTLSNRYDPMEGETVPAEIPYGNSSISYSPIVDLMRRLNFDYVALDEAQFIKNLEAKRTDIAAKLISEIGMRGYIRLSSGTMVSNNSVDVIGQMSMINPIIFPNEEDFIKKYGDILSNENMKKGTFVLKPGGERLITKDMRPFLMRVSGRRRDWSYMLPNIEIKLFPTCPFTDLQRTTYDALLDSKLDALLAAADKNKKKKDKDKEKELTAAEEEELAGKLEASLINVDMFLLAPGMYLPFVEKQLSDLSDAQQAVESISPKAMTAMMIIAQHFGIFSAFEKRMTALYAKAGIDFAANYLDVVPVGSETVRTHIKNIDKDPDHKIVVTSFNVKGSIHTVDMITKYLPELAGRVAHVTSKTRDEIVPKFSNIDDPLAVMVADEKSIETGLNLQVATRMIRQQTRWTPGEQDQAMSRVLRPDKRNKYKRDLIQIFWLYTNQTVDVTKIGRYLSKSVDKFKVEEAENPEARSLILSDAMASFKPLRMTLKNIKALSDMQLMVKEGYLDGYISVNKWEDRQAQKNREDIMAEYKIKLGREIKQTEIASLIETVVDGKSTVLPGSKKIYTPFVTGMTTIPQYNVMTKLGITEFIPSMLLLKKEGTENSDDDNGGSENENNYDKFELVRLKANTAVITEFGVGIVVTDPDKNPDRQRDIKTYKIKVLGFGNKYKPNGIVSVKQSQIFVPKDPRDQALLNKMVVEQPGIFRPFILPFGDEFVKVIGDDVTAEDKLPEPKQIVKAPVTPPITTDEDEDEIDEDVDDTGNNDEIDEETPEDLTGDDEIDEEEPEDLTGDDNELNDNTVDNLVKQLEELKKRFGKDLTGEENEDAPDGKVRLPKINNTPDETEDDEEGSNIHELLGGPAPGSKNVPDETEDDEDGEDVDDDNADNDDNDDDGPTTNTAPTIDAGDIGDDDLDELDDTTPKPSDTPEVIRNKLRNKIRIGKDKKINALNPKQPPAPPTPPPVVTPPKPPKVDTKPKIPTVTPPTPPAPPKPPEPKKKSAIKPNDIGVHASSLNGKLALMIPLQSEVMAEELSKEPGWLHLEPTITIGINTKSGFLDVIKKLDARFSLSPERKQYLLNAANKLANKGNLINTTAIKPTDIKDFFMQEHTRIPAPKGKQKQVIKPWLIIWHNHTTEETVVRLAFSQKAHPTNVITFVEHLDSTPGVGEALKYEDIMVNFVTTKNKAKTEVERLHAKYTLDEAEATLSEINSVRVEK